MAAGRNNKVTGCLENTHPQGGLQAALLIDADNFADPVAIDAAWAQLKSRARRVSVCRAYGSSARLQSMAAVWRKLGARTFPNLSIDKNTTDAALIADAVALYFQHGIRLFAIASGDADFAPLAVRLREWGCEVWCFSIEGILFAGARAYYDRVVTFAPAPLPPPSPPIGIAAPKPAPVPAAPVKQSTSTASTAARVKPSVAKPPATAPAIEPAVTQLALFTATPKQATHNSPATKVVSPPPSPPMPVHQAPSAPAQAANKVQQVLAVFPALASGVPQHLSQVVDALRKAGLLEQNTKTTKWFANFCPEFQLSPSPGPNQIRYLQNTETSPKALPKPSPVSTVAMKPQSSPPSSVGAVTVADVLLAVPELAVGLLMDLNSVSKKLCEKGVVASPSQARSIFAQYPSSFLLRPPKAPNAVQYSG